MEEAESFKYSSSAAFNDLSSLGSRVISLNFDTTPYGFDTKGYLKGNHDTGKPSMDVTLKCISCDALITDAGAYAIMSMESGPFLTMVTLGVAGLSAFPWPTLLGSVLPLLVGMLIGNLDREMRDFLSKAERSFSLVSPCFFRMASTSGFCSVVMPERFRFCHVVIRKSPIFNCAISRSAVFIGQPGRSLMRPLRMCSP